MSKVFIIPPTFRTNCPQWTISKLYKCDLNVRYVRAQVLFMIEDENIEIYKMIMQRLFVLNIIDEYMASRIINESEGYNSPVVQLHHLNVETIMLFSKQLIAEPGTIDERWWRNGGDRFVGEGESRPSMYSFSNYSMRGDTWHPEDLFMDNPLNRDRKYYADVEVSFNPNLRGAGNKWTQTVDKWYNQQFDSDRDPATIYSGNTNPFTPTRRHYASIEDNTEDRRVMINKKIPY